MKLANQVQTQLITTIAEFRAARRTAGKAGYLGLVPTMGYLHEGHLALVRRAKAENEMVAVSIFVNPLQFGPQEDLAAYPRDLAGDLAMLQAEAVDFVFAPTVAEIYPPNFQTSIEVAGLSQGLEGGHRPGHFKGVATVVAKLFNITGANRAYFGQKDAQQVAVVRQMVSDLALPVELVIVPTQREASGLARSSRNVYLSSAQRGAAAVIYRALRAAQAKYQGGERDSAALRGVVRALLAAEPLANTDYVSLANAETLAELKGLVSRRALLSVAVRFGRTRLIDNVFLG
jgi:pantoate--beta-alanine ligase